MPNGVVQTYRAGFLKRIDGPNGQTVTYEYDGGLLVSANDQLGNNLSFQYNTTTDLPVLEFVVASWGPKIHYVYEENKLKKVGYGDQGSTQPEDFHYVTYLYENTNHPTALTGVVDERKRRFATWEYDDNGLAHTSFHGNEKEKYRAFRDTGNPSKVSIFNPFGKESVFWKANTTNPQPSSIEGIGTINCDPSARSLKYDSNERLKYKIDAKDNVQEFIRNDRGLVEMYRSGLNKDYEEGPNLTKIETDWHSQYAMPEERTYSGKDKNGITKTFLFEDWEYDNEGRIEKYTARDLSEITNVFGSTKDQVRIWDYDYTYYAGEDIPEKALIDTMIIDGPLAGNGDSISYHWDQQGNLLSITNALSHTTQYRDHNGRGQPQTVEDPNGIVTKLEYHPRGWLEKTTIQAPGDDRSKDSITDYDWYPNGTLEQIAFPDGSYLHYEYNDARHLTDITNNLDEKITFTPNAMGDWKLAKTQDASENIKRQQQRAFDELGRLMDVFGNNNQHTHYGYDVNNNLETIEEHGETRILNTTMHYDALDRLEKVVKPIQQMVNHSEVPADVITQYTYDPAGNLNSVTDPENKKTTYWNNGFGERIRSISPDTKTTDYWYDAQGNLTDKKDARGVQIKYHYDLLGRLEHIEYLADSSQDVHYYYDEVSAQNPYAKGRLTRVTDPSGSTVYVYDHRGNVTQEIHTIAGTNYTTEYAYNVADRLIQITYPSQRIVHYKRNDLLGRITAVTTQKDAAAAEKTLVSDFDYLPFGPVTQFKYGNGLVRDVPYDLDYRIDKIEVGNALKLDLSYDWFNNITGLTNGINANLSQNFIYDDLHRLQDAYGAYSQNTDHIHYEYDLLGNRVLRQLGAADVTHTEEVYGYFDDSHRLETITKTDLTGTQTRSFTYDDAGNIDTETTYSGDSRSYTHLENNRLIQVAENSNALGDYQHNALGQRVIKTAAGMTTHFHYGPQGELLAESQADGFVNREYVYLHGHMVAVIDNEETTPEAQAAPQKVSAHSGQAGEPDTASQANSPSGGALNLLGLVFLGIVGLFRRGLPKLPVGRLLGAVVVAAVVVGCGSEEEPEDGSTIYYVQTDHLGTPSVITDKAKAPVWEGRRDPFGETVVAVNEIGFDLRFPGQYLDQESGLHYNYYRDYDPGLGRYVQSDPIGLAGGLNTYGYAYQSPLVYSDPEGLNPGGLAGAGIGSFGGPVGAAAGYAIGTVVFVGGIAWNQYEAHKKGLPEEGDDGTSDSDGEKSEECDGDDDSYCKEERRRCGLLCSNAYSDSNRKKVYGGSMQQCIKNCLPQKCGGEPQWKGYTKPPKYKKKGRKKRAKYKF